MDEKKIKECEARGYSKGYKAGMRRLQRELGQQREMAGSPESMRRERVFCAVINGLLAQSGANPNWRMGEAKVCTVKTYIKLANIFVDEAMLQMKFQ